MNLKEKLTHPVFSLIEKVADRNRHQVYAVGGFVRDLLLNRPCADVDCVVMGNGIELGRELCEEIEKKQGSKPDLHEFGQFGTCKFEFEGLEIEFVGARRETYTPGSRKPTVEAGTIEEDQWRRDFSINALALSLNKATFGDLTDPFNGIEDLQNQTIRSHRDPDQSFEEDPLRMLRAIRFASQLFFDIEPETFDAIIRNKEHIRSLSAERITEELNKIILSPKPSYGFKLLDAAEILPVIFPELCTLKGVETRNKKSHKDNFEHTLEVLDHVAYANGNLWLRWAALLHDIAKPKTKRFEEPRGWTFHGHEFIGGKMVPGIFRRFKLPMDENMRFVKKMVELHLRPIILAEDIVTDSAVRRLLFEAGEDIDSLMALAKADITSKNREKVLRYRNNFVIVERKLKELEEKDRIRNFQPPVSGNDIMEYYGLAPCAEIGIIKTRIKDAILDGEIENDRQQAWALMLKTGEELGLSCPKKS
ncbi:MAG: HD domain-containing protein [Lentimicrobiaceae bacterium]|nr:HD domain-containing protein [Lentimicrobiaceae bacterium]